MEQTGTVPWEPACHLILEAKTHKVYMIYQPVVLWGGGGRETCLQSLPGGDPRESQRRWSSKQSDSERSSQHPNEPFLPLTSHGSLKYGRLGAPG